MPNRLDLLYNAVAARRVATTIINPVIAERTKALADEFEQAAGGVQVDEAELEECPELSKDVDRGN